MTLCGRTVNYNIDFDLSQSSDSVYKELAVSSISGTTTDNDSVGVVLELDQYAADGGNGTSDHFTVKLNSQPAAAVQILLQVSDASEVKFHLCNSILILQTVHTPNGHGDRCDDAIVDGNVNFTSHLIYRKYRSSLSIAFSYGYWGINQDNDSAGLVLSSNGPFEVAESGTTQVFTSNSQASQLRM
jgi:hypothetical protein